MVILIHKNNRATNAFHILSQASRHGPQKPEFKSGEYVTFRALEAAGLLETRESGPRGGIQYHITVDGEAALNAAWKQKYEPEA